MEKMIKNLSKNIVKQYSSFERREDLDFRDDGHHFKGYAYKGLPITTLRTAGETYLDIRVDYILSEHLFTWNEWRKTEEYKLADEFNGCVEIDLGKLVYNCERILEKIAELDEAARSEDMDIERLETKLEAESKFAQAVLEKARRDLKWWEIASYELKYVQGYYTQLVSKVEEIERIRKELPTMELKEKRRLNARLEEYGYVLVSATNYGVEELLKACR